MPTTEILTIPLKPGSDISDPSNEAAKIVKDFSTEVSKFKGVQQIYFGMQVENPQLFRLVVIWDSLEAHHAFMSSETTQPLRNNFRKMAAGPPTMFNVDLDPADEAMKSFDAPVTEFANVLFAADPPETYIAGVNQFRDAVTKAPVKGVLSSAVGFTHEEIQLEGVKGKGALLVVGFSGLEVLQPFTQSDVYKQNVGCLTAGAQKSDVHRVMLLKFVAEQ